MAYQLNEKLANLVPYEPISGDYPIRLDANESFVHPPKELLELMGKAAVEAAFNRYPDPYAEKLCQAFATYYGISSDFVTAGNGSDELISVIMSAFPMKGAKILTVEPDFSMYRFYTSIAECPNRVIMKNENFCIDIEEMLACIQQENIKLVIFSNPCNPTSVGVTAQEIQKLLVHTSALVVLDEAYMDFWSESLLHDVQKYDNLIILRTCSKAVGLAALRVGFAVANQKLTNALRAVKSPYNVNSVSQAMATVIFEHPQYLEDALSQILASRDVLFQEMKKLEAIYPSCIHVTDTVTNFIFAWFNDAKGLFEFLKQKGVVVRHMGDYLRITAGTPEENRSVIAGIHSFMDMEA